MQKILRTLSILVLLTSSQEILAGSSPLAGRHVQALSDIGRGVAVIFSPDLTAPGSRAFYERLGFQYIETPSWAEALHELARGEDVRLVLVETHGTNGHGLKIQLSGEPGAARSYISVGALQERIEEAEIPAAVISACNSGRLFRPGIYKALDPAPEEPLFLPPTLGILQASARFDPETSRSTLLRRRESNLESLMEGKASEFSNLTRGALRLDESVDAPFVVSTMLIQMLLGDPELELTTEGYVETLSRKDFTAQERERLFLRFVDYVNGVALQETMSR